MKIFIALFAFLAVQGWTSARFITDDFLEDIPEDIWNFVESAELSDVSIFADLPVHEFVGEESAADPKNCLPYIQDAYDDAVEFRRILNKARELGKKLKEEAKKCRAIIKPSDKKKCYEDLKQMAINEGKPLKDAYMALRPKIIDIMDKFDKCMAGQTEDVPVPAKAEQCLPYVQEAYDTAVEVRRIVVKAHELAKKLEEGYKKCKALTTPVEKLKCFEELKRQAIAEGKPLKDAYMKIRPKVLEVMDKFDKCMAA